MAEPYDAERIHLLGNSLNNILKSGAAPPLDNSVSCYEQQHFNDIALATFNLLRSLAYDTRIRIAAYILMRSLNDYV